MHFTFHVISYYYGYKLYQKGYGSQIQLSLNKFNMNDYLINLFLMSVNFMFGIRYMHFVMATINV